MEEALNARGIELITSEQSKGKTKCWKIILNIAKMNRNILSYKRNQLFWRLLGKIELLIDEYNKQFKKAEAVSKNQMFLESQILKFLKKRWIL
ncbi:hypothetical protein NPA07_04105 [Mycoplasmopsis caviae]|uniref:Transposase n=1 Tax=Mycoplasmopsis caviae TaxID=55603 RepID=A0ABY5IZB5_9BACT|nr:hypothetical protein [Mycoplasmopsis caviae]UUD34964.1 hypothetical protein NPA07_04105 [Mycoplasmopsis caviae]